MPKSTAVLIFILILLIGCNNKNNGNESKNNNIISQSAINKDMEENNNIEKQTVVTEQAVNISEEAKQLNTEGYRLYKKKKYKEALDKFKKSFESDDDYAMAHYNYACTIGVLLKLDYEEWYGQKEEVIEHLNKAIKLDKKYIAKIKKDKDLEEIRDSFEYYLLIGLSPEKTEDVKEILDSLTWYIQGSGVVNPLGGIYFGEDGFTLWYRSPDFFKEYDISYPMLEYDGKYKVNNNKIKLYLTKKMLRKKDEGDIQSNKTEYEDKLIINGTLEKKGDLKFEIFDYPITSWIDEFST